MNALVHICEYFPKLYTFTDSFAGDWVYDVLTDVAPPHLETWTYCKWLDEFVPSEDCSVPVLTEEGLCFAFNAVNSHEIYTAA